MGAQKTPLQKTYKISTGSESLNVEFLGSNRQFDWIEISIVPDKNNKHNGVRQLQQKTRVAINKISETEQLHRNL